MNYQRKEFRARHILCEELEDAEYVLEKLKKGEEFSELATQLSECDSASKGGELGRFYAGQMVAEFEKALDGLEIQEISGPVRSKFGYHIIQKLAL
ncbi:MAG: hypothetical protein HN509_16560 [Halobacteriovoraceae bacterium]|jgi:parvulin-like peptidyl-prolyl isomerase|nr:hypothetical protein [Halobacteriovoraceae bacterium]MBT5092819.1 hypothetical protein [Halobacteriovoraceae bacterium]